METCYQFLWEGSPSVYVNKKGFVELSTVATQGNHVRNPFSLLHPLPSPHPNNTSGVYLHSHTICGTGMLFKKTGFRSLVKLLHYNQAVSKQGRKRTECQEWLSCFPHPQKAGKSGGDGPCPHLEGRSRGFPPSYQGEICKETVVSFPYLCVSSYWLFKIVVTEVVKSALSFQMGTEQVWTC